MSIHRPAARQRGFTLIEAIVVIVITAIIGGMVAVFIRMPVQGYVDMVARAEVTDLADTAMHRIKRDIRLALPNSLRVTQVAGVQYIEFLLTKAGGRYLADEDNAAAAGTILDWGNVANRAFTVVGGAGAMPTGKQTILAGDYLVIYNLGDGQEPANAYVNCTGVAQCNRAVIQNVAGNLITLVENPFAAQVSLNPQEPMAKWQSPGMRFQVVTSAVSYVCDPARRTLTRYWNYAITVAQPADLTLLAAPDANKGLTAASHALLANNVSTCSFDYLNLANIHSGLITLRLAFENLGSNSGVVTLVQQVHVDNTP
jgi:MSHA biogenesis protein MshO